MQTGFLFITSSRLLFLLTLLLKKTKKQKNKKGKNKYYLSDGRQISSICFFEEFVFNLLCDCAINHIEFSIYFKKFFARKFL